MLVKGLVEEDFVQYRKPSMVVMMPNCNWKCGKGLCQNSPLALSDTLEVEPLVLVSRYLNNPLTSALVFSGLEPLDDFDDVLRMITMFRGASQDDIVIYTGYNKDEVLPQLEQLLPFGNIYVKFGRFRPNQMVHFDSILGVDLASDNQFAEKIC